MSLPDNLVALHHQETGSYVVDGQEALAINPLDKWAVRKILSQNERIEELETMVKVFRGCIETGGLPAQGSRCHKMVYDLVGERDDEQARLVHLQRTKGPSSVRSGPQSENRAGPVAVQAAEKED